jgi:hypothetical protein
VIKGEYDKGAKEFKEALALAGKDDQAQALHRAYAKDGLRGLLKAQIKLWSHPEKPDDYDPESVAQNYALLGNPENAFLWLDRAYADNDKIPNGNLLDIKVEPFFGQYSLGSALQCVSPPHGISAIRGALRWISRSVNQRVFWYRRSRYY